MEERGIVKEVRGERVLVEIERSALCDGCKAQGSCTLMSDQSARRVWLDNNISAAEGDIVTLSLDDMRVLKGSFIFYLVPLIFLFIGAGAGKLLSKLESFRALIENIFGGYLATLLFRPDNLSILFGLLLLFASFFGVWLYSRKALRQGEFRPRIIGIVN